MARPPLPEDLYRLRIATDPRLSPDGSLAAVTVQTTTPRRDGYQHAIWALPLEKGGGEPRQLTIGGRHDKNARFSPDGKTLAFLSDRRLQVEDEPDLPKDAKDREDGTQIYVLPLAGGEARRLTDLPRGVDDFAWSPDSSQIVVTTSSHGATRKEDRRARGLGAKRDPGDPPESDYRYIDRLGYMSNGPGFVYDAVAHIWLVDVATGTAHRLTDGRAADHAPAWSPDGTRVAYATNLHRDDDMASRSHIVVVDVAGGRRTRVTGGSDSFYFGPTWLPDGKTLIVHGGRVPANAYRLDIWRFGSDGSDARVRGGINLSGQHDLMPGAAMNSDVTPAEAARFRPSADGRWLTFSAPIAGSYELWRIDTRNGARLERLTEGPHYISAFDQVERAGKLRTVYLRSTPAEPPELWLLDGVSATPRKVSSFNADVLAELELHQPIERHVTVDGRDIQGWFIPAGPAGRASRTGRAGPARSGKVTRPLVTEIHGGPHTLYGWSPVFEFQVLAGSGIGVYYSNPRGSEGYGRDFNEANLRDWGPGPMRDVIAGIDSLVADGLADPERLGVTGGSYGGYLTNWMIAQDPRFRAAITCRSVSDMAMLFLTGDIGGRDWAMLEFGTTPWEDPEFYRRISPLTYADGIHTPLLIQHSEHDLRTTIGQAEALFTVLRSKHRPVRLTRVPDETHELTRSGAPFRRAENLVQVRDWFRHYLVDGKRGLPPLPKARAGK